ncbi:YopX protein [compost metagenome]
MNREIKFRFWSGTKMFCDIENVMECLKQQLYFEANKTDKLGFDHIGEYNSAFMQFTGLKDKNGVEIYEGDIVSVATVESDKVGRFFVKTELPKFINSVVKYDNIQCKYFLQFEKNEAGLLSCEIGWGREIFEIIGNIYEHPVLLT